MNDKLSSCNFSKNADNRRKTQQRKKEFNFFTNYFVVKLTNTQVQNNN